MARIAQTEIERLKSEVSVERLIEQSGITLKKAGKDLIGCCPFHADATASLVVTPVKNLWHCFGCGAAGGVIDWVMQQSGVSFRHAVELLRADMTGSVDPASAATGSPSTPIKSAPVKKATVPKLTAPIAFNADDQGLLNQVIDYYHDTLKQSPEALAYLASRGFTGQAAMDMIATFKLGLANRTLGLRLPHKNRIAGADIRTRLEKIGIYRASGHEHFNGSLIIPIVDANGQVQEIYGRKLLDNLRAGTPKHLYLPSEHRAGGRGVFNLAAFTACKEIILCEALIDALTFWCAGYRNVTSSYGIEGFTDDMLAAFKTYGTQRVLIAYDRDDAGERGADKVAAQLMQAGIDCFRIQFPKGMDANAYALKVTPATKSLGVVIRKALWLGNGQAPQREAAEAMIEPAPDQPTPQAVAADPVTRVETRAEPFATAIDLALPAMAIPLAPPADVAAEVNAQEVVMGFGTGDDSRRWRVRGMLNNLAVGVLKVNLMVSNQRAFHIDSLDLYAARARAVFLQQAAAELHLSEALLKTELGRVLLKLEQLQDAHLQAALTPQAPATPAMSDTEHAAALALLRTPALLARILTDFEACGMVGEATNTLTAYLAATSRKLERPLAVVVQSSSAAGKSSLMDAVLALMPPEETIRYSAMSGQSLFYMGATSLKHKILAIAEEAGAARASYALKLLQSDGELTMASTGTDANGNLVTQEYRVEGPMSLFMTTTAIDVDEELMNRCLVLSVDEGRTQTAAIHQRQRERRTLAGLIGRGQREAVLNLHRNAQRLLRPLFVVNPYADRLTFLDDRTRTRRDHDKF